MSIPISSRETTLQANTTTATRPVVQQQRPTQPQIIVFDSFYNSNATFDYNDDGIRDRTHGSVVSDIIKSQTGYSTQNIDVGESGGKQEIFDTLKPLLQHNDLAGTYINLSIDWGNDSETNQLLLQLADKGAKIYIAAGNEDISSSATKTLGQHQNIFIVASSDGIIGELMETQATRQHISNPAADRITNGVLQPIANQNGIDLNRDGNIDFPNSILRKPYTNLSGRSRDQVYASSLLSSIRSTQGINHQLDLTGRDDIQDKVLSIKDLRELGFINEHIDKYLKENYRITDESKTLIDLEPFAEYLLFFGEGGDIVLYQEQQNSLARLLPSYTPRPATSWASPNALSEDILKDFGHS